MTFFGLFPAVRWSERSAAAGRVRTASWTRWLRGGWHDLLPARKRGKKSLFYSTGQIFMLLGDFLGGFCNSLFNTDSSASPSDSTMWEDAEIVSRTVALQH